MTCWEGISSAGRGLELSTGSQVLRYALRRASRPRYLT